MELKRITNIRGSLLMLEITKNKKPRHERGLE
jgi:hypothetical protein